MRVLVLGSGAREHALAWRLASSPHVRAVVVGPGNAGTAEIAVNAPEVDPLDFGTVLDACKAHSIDCVFVGPEAPLADGIVDHLGSKGVAAIGPGKRASRLESSKAFSKAFLTRNLIPTAEAREFSDPADFEAHVRGQSGRRLVVKKSGLAAGKGVLESSSVNEMVAFGRSILADDRLLVEEFLEGWEVSIFGLSDGKSHMILPPCTDFKKAHDGDTGPNTGGMGSICPVPWVDEALSARIRAEVVEPTYAALAREGLAYSGVLYFGLMITASGPKVLEFNVRFGDPETQVLLPVIGLDLGELVAAMAAGKLKEVSPADANQRKGAGAALGAPASAGLRPARAAALGVVVASRGYPESSEKSVIVDPIPAFPSQEALVFHASTSRGADGLVRTGGGRCFTVVGLGIDLREASVNAYRAVERVRFDGGWYRRDIGRRFFMDGGRQ
jgi:phosphoribosylamine--glycine ligase